MVGEADMLAEYKAHFGLDNADALEVAAEVNLETVLSVILKATDRLESWFARPVVKCLRNVGIVTLADLVNFINGCILKKYTVKFLIAIWAWNISGNQPALAQHFNVDGAPCKGILPTSDLIGCLEAASNSADSKINETYSRIQSALSRRKDDLNNLAEAQRAWAHFQATTCNAEYQLFAGGSGGPAAKLACAEAQARVRNSDLLNTYGWLLEKNGK